MSVRRDPVLMVRAFETIATTIEEVQEFAQVLQLQPNPIDRSLAAALLERAIPEAMRFKKWIERRKRQAAKLTDGLSSRDVVYEGRTRGVRRSYNVDAMFDELGIKKLERGRRV